MYSSIKGKKLDVFEEQLKLRKVVLSKILKIDKKLFEDENIIDIFTKVERFEIDIKKDAEVFKSEILKKQVDSKVEFSAIKKAKNISTKYKYGNVETYKSSYIDKKR